MFPLTFNIHEANLQTATDRCNQYADDTTLYAYVEFFWPKASLPTPSCYSQGQRKFIDVWTQRGNFHSSGFPADEWTLSLFSTFLANSVQHSTIMVYLPAVRSLHIDQGFPDPPWSIAFVFRECYRASSSHKEQQFAFQLPPSYWPSS